MAGGGKATRTVDDVVAGTPAAAVGLRAGDKIVAIDGNPVAADEIAETISSSAGRPLTLIVERDGNAWRSARCVRERTDGTYRLGFVLRGEGLGVGRIDLARPCG